MSELPALKSEGIPEEFDTPLSLPKLKDSNRPHHILIFLDGTWNEERSEIGETTPTNVLRMYQEINHRTLHELKSLPDNDDSHRIIAHYYRGVGSRQDNNRKDQLIYGFNGEDEKRIRSAAFADVYNDYSHKNDCIYIIGFSRGAASARLLAKDICEKGLPPQLNVKTSYFPNLLTGQIETRVINVERLEKGKGENNHRPNIAFLGCWDTVDAFVLPSRAPENRILDKLYYTIKKYTIPNMFRKERFQGDENSIPDKVENAVHCVAIDETRNAFLPTLMPYSKDVEEVWFPGVHADVGGGYADNLLADAPYNFMQARLTKATGINFNELFFSSENKSTSSGYCFHFWGLNTGLMKKVKSVLGIGSAMRRIHVLGANNAIVKPKIHKSYNIITNSGSVFAANEKEKRTWTITYDPYNIEELKGYFDDIEEEGSRGQST